MSALTFLQDVSFAQLFILSIVWAVTFISIRSWLSRPINLPPGPRGYPILGAIPLLKPAIHETYKEWANTYGDLFSVYFGNKLVVVASGTSTIKDVFQRNGEYIVDRSKSLKTGFYNFGEGMILGDGPVWKEHRKLMMKGLRVLTSKGTLESRIQKECRTIVTLLSKEKGQPFDPTADIFNAIVNISMTVFYGIELEHDSEEFKNALKILNLIGDIDIASPSLVLPQVVPLLRPLFYISAWKGTKKMESFTQAVGGFVGKLVSDSRQTYDENVTRGILDTYFHRQLMDEKQGEKCVFDENELIQVAIDMFVAASDTTLSTLRWGILFMLHNPEVQKKVLAEIDSVIGPDRLPAMADKPLMPYTDATTCEIQRRGNISFIGVPGTATQDIRVGDYVIPKGCQVSPHLHFLHRDPRYWKDPETFDPSRFLDESGHNVIKPEAFMPFGLGPRICLGDNLAKMEIFLMFTTLIQRFEISAIDKNNLPSLEIKRGIVFRPYPYQIKAVPR